MVHALTALVICLAHVGVCSANYACICSYTDDTIVYSEANVSSAPLGHLSSWDSKQLLSLQVASQWVPLAFKHQVGYVEEDPSVMVQMCTGSPPIVDHLTTTTTTTPIPTTTTRTTTTASTTPTTTTTTTTRPLTTPSTTSAATWTPRPTSSTGNNHDHSPVYQHWGVNGHNHDHSPVPVYHHLGVNGNTQLCPLKLRQAASSGHIALGHFGTKCYSLNPHHCDSWGNSEASCAKHGAHLVHIRSAAEQEFVHNFVAKHAHGQWVWIGLNDRHREGEYKWSNGGRLRYSHWYMFHKVACTDIDDCVAMRPNGYWDDINCGLNFMGQVIGSKHLFLCEHVWKQYLKRYQEYKNYGRTQSLFG